MNLNNILNQIKVPFKIYSNINYENIIFENIEIDSRKVNNSSIFFGLIGTKNDGANFLQDVANKGCKLAVIDINSKFNFHNFLNSNPQNIIIVGNCYEILIEFLKIKYSNLPENIYAITGTNGKTSCAEFVRQMLDFLNIKSASIGTIGVNSSQKINTNFEESFLTTPDIVGLYKNLSILKNNGINDVAIEVSSIGLEQNRIGGLHIKVGAFTNFTQDHLDYHKTMKNYFDCKMLLFNKIVNNGYAILNADIKEYQEIYKICNNLDLNILNYGKQANAFKITKIHENNVEFMYKSKIYNFENVLKGDFQIYNTLCALACIVAVHQPDEHHMTKLVSNFYKLKSAQGRMQKVCNFRGAEIFIDFAHSPDAIENILKLSKNLAKNRIIILFGCGGDRDATKRPIMGKIASNYADLIVISDDNPRTEDPALIRQQILNECDLKKTLEIADRKNAIEKTIEILQDGDVLIIAGKGHENYQIIGTKKFDFNEEQIIIDVVNKLS